MKETAETDFFSLEWTLKYKIEDFSTAHGEIWKRHVEKGNSFSIDSLVSVFPDGAGENDKGWLVVRPEVKVNYFSSRFVLFCSMNIIDIEGNYKFPGYFETRSHNIRDNKNDDFKNAKYLKRSFILERADELTSRGELILKCDIRIDIYLQKKKFEYLNDKKFSDSILKSVIDKETEPAYQGITTTVYDFTCQILTLPQFHESRKRFGVYGIPPAESMNVSKVDNADSLEDIWIFDTNSSPLLPDYGSTRFRYLLSFAPGPGNVGCLLAKASPVIQRCISAPMKERHEKHVDLSHVHGDLFLLVLQYLASGELSTNSLLALIDLYQFSHMYDMRNLNKECARRLVKICPSEYVMQALGNIARWYSDDYFLNLLESRLRDFGNSDSTRMDDKPNIDCYN